MELTTAIVASAACALTAGMGVTVQMAVSARRRRLRLARAAHELGLQFADEDPFDLARRYQGFVLPGAGHSMRARNVLYGRCRGWHVRAFDYSFETAHGSRRQARRHGVIVVDVDMDLPPALLWHAEDLEHAPLEAARAGVRILDWHAIGRRDFAAALAEAFREHAQEKLSLQSLHRSLMVCVPGRWRPQDLPDRLIGVCRVLEDIRARLGAPAAAG